MAKKLPVWQQALIGLILGGIVAFFFIAPDEQKASPQQQGQEVLSPTSEQLVTGISEQLQKWQHPVPFTVEVSEYEKNNIRLAAIFPQEQAITMEAAQTTANNTVIAALNTLIKHGRNPAEEWVLVKCFTRQPAGKGTTGQPLTRVFGVAHYDFNTDSVEWEVITQ